MANMEKGEEKIICFIVWQIKYHDKGFTNYKIFISIFWEKGHLKMYQGRRDISIIWETRDSILRERFYSLGMGPHSLEIRLCNYPVGHSGHTLGNGTRFPLGFGPLILWESSSEKTLFGRWGTTQEKLSSGNKDILASVKVTSYSYTGRDKSPSKIHFFVEKGYRRLSHKTYCKYNFFVIYR